MSTTCCQARFFILIFLMNLAGSSAQADAYVAKLQGQEANLTFPYPCDSTEVTLQQLIQTPFYRSTDIPSLSLHGSQVGRFRVQNRNDNGSCSLELTISDLKRYDQETYVLFVYKDGHILQNAMQKIHLDVDYPPGKASCVVGEDEGIELVSLNCTASAGSIPGDIECYQNGVWLQPPYLTYPKKDAPVNQIFFIRKAQPTFCCSIKWGEHKKRCQCTCNDFSLYLLDGYSNDPCPPPLKMNTKPTTVTQYNQSNQHSTPTASIPPEKYRNTIQVVLWSASISIAVTCILLLACLLYCHRKKNIKRKVSEYFQMISNLDIHNKKKCPDPEEPSGMEQTESFM